ncbi:hypothetical protein BC332_31089 [Capsicum chinense]|nr:hypothetical protein BC332_31089 [Capsicum chinense]
MADHHVLKIPLLPPSLPDPPDPMETQSNTDLSKETIKDSFKVVLLNKETSLNGPFVASDKGKSPMIPQDPEGVVNLSEKDKERIYAPWKFSVIVKVFNKKLAHNYLKIKLTKLWKLTEPLTLIDLGYDYYVAKFNNPERKFLSVRKWEPNFVPEEATQTHSAIWTRLPQLPTELYDRNILERIESLDTVMKGTTKEPSTLVNRKCGETDDSKGSNYSEGKGLGTIQDPQTWYPTRLNLSMREEGLEDEDECLRSAKTDVDE